MSSINSGGISTSQLVGMLSLSTGRPVIDRTGLLGFFAMKLEFAGEPGSTPAIVPVAPGTSSGAPADTPSLFSAIQEQLGLKLESRREPTEVLVIDQAEPPIAD